MARGRELELLASKGRTRQGWRARLDALFARKHLAQSYQALFVTAEGELTHHGARVLDDMARVAGLGKVRPDASPAELHYREGKRAMLLHVLAQLEPDAIDKLARQIREAKNERTESD